MMLKVMKEAPVLPQAKAEAKALKLKKAVLKGVHSHKEKKSHMSSTFQCPRTSSAECSQEKLAGPLRHHQLISLTPELAMKKTGDKHTLVLIADAKASKRHTQQAVKKPSDADAATVNTLLGPDGEEKADIPLATD
ncbi:hypothetical protein P7K49_018574 [Saguinus oedipus]|uniref:Large ribosomal subunit protein uL23 N-terminal domain-containing protein n=1 Tax=Saguinus oedipus TaxID=9490 RepID=A0ABQ9V5R3_SAGOE|nr:hypothetical protein P7K49_018574 [Saguinus oedipus]